jgi:hypothetical protein
MPKGPLVETYVTGAPHEFTALLRASLPMGYRLSRTFPDLNPSEFWLLNSDYLSSNYKLRIVSHA